MKQHYPKAGWAKLCGLFGKTRQALYDHEQRASHDQLQHALIISLVNSIRLSLPKVGGLKLLYMLRADFAAHNITIGRDCFFRLLRNNNLLVKHKKRYARTTDSNHIYKKWPDLSKSLQLKAAQQLWVSDITYLTTQTSFIYLSLITDAWSHKIVGYHLSQHLKAKGCIIALNKAISTLSADASVVHHSDRGIQYCCDAYVSVLQSNNIAVSMTQTGSPYDNAVAERANGILKTELRLNEVFENYTAAIPVVHQAIDAYNRIRPHMSCGNLTPNEAHDHQGPLVKKWKPKKYCKAKSVLL